MPINKDIVVNCKVKDCYWNLGKYKNNCASSEILLQDTRCAHFITKQEAERRLAIIFDRKDIATRCTM